MNTTAAISAAAQTGITNISNGERSVNLGLQKIDDTDTVAIAGSITWNITLNKLYLHDNRVGDAGATALAEALRVNWTLHTLFLNKNQIGNAGALALAEAIKFNKTLQTLSLFKNQIGDMGVVAIAEAIRVNKSLLELSVSDNQITDVGAIAIAESLFGNTNLKTLRLTNNKAITDISVPAIKEALRCSNVKNFDIYSGSGTSISAPNIAEIKTLMALLIDRRSIGRNAEQRRAEQEKEMSRRKLEEARKKAEEETKKREYVLFSLIQQLDLTGFFAESTKMQKENASANMVAVAFELAIMNQHHQSLMKKFKTSIQSVPVKELEKKLMIEKQELDDAEKKIQDGIVAFGVKRDAHRENVIEIANQLQDKRIGSQKPRSGLISIKDQLSNVESQMKRVIDVIGGMKQQAHASLSLTLSSAGNDGGLSQLEQERRDRLFPVPDPQNKAIVETPWMIELRNEVANVKKDIEATSAAVSKLGDKMNDLVKRMSPTIENVINEAQSLILECKETFSEYEQTLEGVDVEKIVPDIEKQIELYEQRQKIRICLDDLKNTNDEIHTEEIKMADMNHAQHKLGGAAAIALDESFESLESIDDVRAKLNHLKAHRDELVELITELCFDQTDPSICRFPDLKPPRSLANDTSKSLFRVPKLLKIRPRYYTIREQLGAGGFAQVFRVEYQKPGHEMEVLAFKKFPGMQLGDREASVVADEIETLAGLDHPNIIKLLGVSDDPDSRDGNDERLGIGMIMEYCENGSLRKYLNHTLHSDMGLVIRILSDVSEGMKYLHQHEPNAIIHRDLKSDNILLDKDMNAKICDFGIAKIIEATSAKRHTATAGTAQYKAPESYDGVFEQCSDVYSFGCVIFEILSGKRPWDGLSDVQVIKNILKEMPLDLSIIRQDAPTEVVGLMKQCLDYDKSKRPLFSKICVALNRLIPPVVLTILDPSSDEFTAIGERLFPPGKEGSLSKTRFQIVEITKVRNEFTESLFEAEKTNIKREMTSGNVNEYFLFHGTRQVDPLEVVKHRYGMMKDFSDRENMYYGRGIYFAELPRYSHSGFVHRTRNGQFQLLLCSVICGNSLEMGKRIDDETRGFSQKKLPIHNHSIFAGPHGKEPNDSRMVVIYKDSQCTPRYIITYSPV